MNSNPKVTVVIPTDSELHLLDEVLNRLKEQHAEVAIYLDGKQPPADLQTQIKQWLTAVYQPVA
jgi:hypothetical protein